MRLSDLLVLFDQIAPLRAAESWDNVGLIAGDSSQSVSRAMLTIDYTPAVAQEAKEANCDLVYAYHPPIFEATKRITAGGTTDLIFDAVRRGIALYSPHTALDFAEGGTNDMLADAIAMKDRQPLRVSAGKSTQYKLVVFVPADIADRVADALFAAGAGKIGDYASCSFRTNGTGTFVGGEGSNPTIGKPGQMERVDEICIETIVPIAKVDAVIRALRKAHPYEEPAFDLLQLAAAPEGWGAGRVGAIPEGATAEMLINLLKQELDLDRVLVAGPIDRVITRAAVCAGSCGNFLDDAIAAKVDLYLTGEMRHHDALKAAKAGLTVVCLLHSNSERAVLKRVKQRIEKEASGLQVLLSKTDRDPFSII